jgi:hypothetical protein
MTSSRLGRSVRALLDRLLIRPHPPPSEARRAESERDRARIAFAEMVAAATVLDFGGLPVEAPTLGEVWPTDHRE